METRLSIKWNLIIQINVIFNVLPQCDPIQGEIPVIDLSEHFTYLKGQLGRWEYDFSFSDFATVLN